MSWVSNRGEHRVVRQRSMCGTPVAWTLKICYDQHYILRVQNVQSGVSYNNGVESSKEGLRGAILGSWIQFLTRADDMIILSLLQEPICIPLYTEEGMGTNQVGSNLGLLHLVHSVPSSCCRRVLICRVRGGEQCHNHSLTSLL